MEVTHVKDHVTHAVVGGQQAESFGISDDPAFFHVLSSTLYRDKRRAVIRETLCNAWDAHIEAGITGMPIEVTLTTNKLTIQDFGFGIDKMLIKPIYGVYGASTKKKNKDVTGGFGLGCKAPFAYVDHFEVTSCHEGEKTIYRMSKSSGAVMGKPSIQPILSIPTDDTGITVSMEVKSGEDYVHFERLIRQIAFLGEMKVKLNGELLKSAPFSEAKHGFLVIKSEDFGEGSEHEIQVRYGNVTYPIEKNDAYADLYKNAKQFLKQITTRTDTFYRRYGFNREEGSGWVVILQAKPDTISVTPSRESLSMTDHTIETVKSLLETFASNTQNNVDLRKICLELTEETIQATWLMGSPSNLLSADKELPNKRALEHLTSPYITEMQDVGGHYLRNQYPEWKGFYHKDIMMRLNFLIQSGFGKKGLIQTYRAAYLKARGKNNSHRHEWQRNGAMQALGHHWFVRRLITPIKLAIASEPKLDFRRLFVWTDGVRNGRGYSTGYGTIPVLDYVTTLGAMMPFLRGIVIVAFNRRDIEDRTHHFPAMKFWFGHPKNNLCYISPRNAERAAAAVAFFEKQGFTVIDLTKKQKWEHEEILTPVARPRGPVKKRVKGFYLLSELTDVHKDAIQTLFDENAKRIENPEFWVKLSPRQERVHQLDNAFKHITVMPLVRLYGDKGAVIVTSAQEKKVVEAGAKDFKNWAFDQLLNAFKTNPEVQEYYETSVQHNEEVDLNWQDAALYRAILAHKSLRQEFKLPTKQPSQTVRDIAEVIASFEEYEERYYPQLKEIFALRKQWTLNADVKALCEMIKNAKLMAVINSHEMAAVLNTTGGHYTAAQQDMAKTMLLSALKG